MDQHETERVAHLFSEEIPEIANGVVEIKAIARIPGIRCKVAIQSRSPAIDAMSVCVGTGGSRLHRMIDKLQGERIELVRWDDCPETLIVNALQPTKIHQVLLDPSKHQATVLVSEDQMSLVTGIRGSQNRELASLLTGWQIDVRTFEPSDRKP